MLIPAINPLDIFKYKQKSWICSLQACELKYRQGEKHYRWIFDPKSDTPLFFICLPQFPSHDGIKTNMFTWLAQLDAMTFYQHSSSDCGCSFGSFFVISTVFLMVTLPRLMLPLAPLAAHGSSCIVDSGSTAIIISAAAITSAAFAHIIPIQLWSTH